MPSLTVPVVSTLKALPAVPMEKRERGDVVPMPTFPFASTVIKVVVEVPPVVEAMVKSGVLTAVTAELLSEKSE